MSDPVNPILLPEVRTPPEREELDLLRECFRLAAEDCDRLAKGERGYIYEAFRERLKVIERAARRVAVNHRADARWLAVGDMAEKAHQNVGNWLRSKAAPQKFALMARILRDGEQAATQLRNQRTGRRGPILPVVRPLPYVRQGRPTQILLPPGFVDRRPQ